MRPAIHTVNANHSDPRLYEVTRIIREEHVKDVRNGGSTGFVPRNRGAGKEDLVTGMSFGRAKRKRIADGCADFFSQGGSCISPHRVGTIRDEIDVEGFPFRALGMSGVQESHEN